MFSGILRKDCHRSELNVDIAQRKQGMDSRRIVLLFDIRSGIIGTKGGVSDGSENSKCLGPYRA